MTWTSNISFAVGDNLDRNEDGLLGNGLFQDRVLEINYDRKLMIVRDSLPIIPAGYSRQTMVLDGVVPLVKASIVLGNETFTDWYMFDTGYSGQLRISATISERYALNDKAPRAFNPFKKTFVLPHFRIGEQRVDNLRAVVHPIDPGRPFVGLMGNELLKRFNVILDNRNGYLYLARNGLKD